MGIFLGKCGFHLWSIFLFRILTRISWSMLNLNVIISIVANYREYFQEKISRKYIQHVLAVNNCNEIILNNSILLSYNNNNNININNNNNNNNNNQKKKKKKKKKKIQRLEDYIGKHVQGLDYSHHKQYWQHDGQQIDKNKEKQLYGRFKLRIKNILHQKTWTGLRKGNFKREAKSLLIINHKFSECSKLSQEEYNTRHDWVDKVIHRETWKKLKFDHTN